MRTCIAVLALAAGVSAAQAAKQKPKVKLFAAGNDRVLWLVVGQWNAQEETYCHSFAVTDTSSAQVRAAARIAPQKGTIERIAAVGKDVDVFYGPDARYSEDGAHYRYDRSGGGRALSLPGAVMPSAIAGESTGDLPRLWAVVPATTAEAVRLAWEKEQSRTTEPADTDESSDAPPASAASRPAATTAPASPPEAYHLVQYDGVNWQPGFPAPATCESSEHLWLALAANRFHLFWQVEPTETQVHYAWYEKNAWVIGPTLPLDAPPVEALATVINAGLVFAALYHTAPGSPALHVRLWTWQSGSPRDGAASLDTPRQPSAADRSAIAGEAGGGVSRASTGSWSRLSDLKASVGKDLVLPADAALSAFVDKLAVLRAGDRPAEFALFAPMTGGPPDRPFQEIPQVGTANISKTQRNLRDLVATLVVAALLLLVFWRRQESIATPIPLPAGVAVAGPGKRAAAAFVDMIPAAVVAGSIWYQPIREFILESQAAMAAGQSEGVPAPDAVMWAWLCYVVIYTVWCTFFEILWLTTPGKRLMGCEVRQESFGEPNAVQIIIRNITKIIELLPYLQIWPFMLVVFFTRNHQRLGDLLAHTVVIERQHVVADANDRNDDSNYRG